MSGAAVDIAGLPPRQFRVKKTDPGPELSKPPSLTRGRPVRPVFYQHSGLLEYVWFDCGVATPAVLYDQVIRPLGRLDFTLHDEHKAIHIRREGQVIGLLWPCFIDAHCRVTPSLQHPCFAHNASQVEKLRELLKQKTGLSIITGGGTGAGAARTFLLTALGNACGRLPLQSQMPVGIDRHRPVDFVPVESPFYIDGSLGLEHIRRLTLELFPKLLTSPSSTWLLNGIWSAVPEIQEDLIQCAGRRHVILAEQEVPDFTHLELGSNERRH